MNKKSFSILALIFIAAIAAIFLSMPPAVQKAEAGVYQYNNTYSNTLANPAAPTLLISNQYHAGICSGTFAPGAPLTNSFPDGLYTVAPVVTATGSGTATNNIIAVSVVTTSGFQLTAISTNGVTIYWTAVGH